MVNMRHETFERPYITFFNKLQSNKSIAISLDKFETFNLNPYVVVVED